MSETYLVDSAQPTSSHDSALIGIRILNGGLLQTRIIPSKSDDNVRHCR
jgi:hypothetical protein